MDHAKNSQARPSKTGADSSTGRDGAREGDDGAAARTGLAGSDRARIANYFGDRLARFGPVLSACDYGSPPSQQTRFRVIRDVLPLAGLRVLDVGCGLAHLADDFEAAQIALGYEGVDICPAMIEQAKRRRPDLRLSVRDVLCEGTDRAEHRDEHRAEYRVRAGAYDVVVANGIFYLLQTDPVATMQRIIARLFALADRCVVFTSLSTWASRAQPGEFQADPLTTLDFCRTLTPHVVLRHDYLPHDFAVYLYREVERA